MNHPLLIELARFQEWYPGLADFGLGLLKSSAILLMAWSVALLLGKHSTLARSWVWRSALFLLGILYLWPVIPLPQQGLTLEAKPSSFTSYPDPVVQTISSPTASPEMGFTPARHPASAPGWLKTMERFVTVAWYTMAGILILIHLLRLLLAHTWLQKNAVPAGPKWNDRSPGLGIYITPVIDTPLLAGLLRPAIYLPEESKTWTIEKQNCVILHERAHHSRYDVWWQFIGTCLTSLWWWNPLAWFALGQLKAEAEKAADESVVRQTGKPESYARHLVEIAALFSRPAPTGVPMLGRFPLEQRVLAIVNPALLENRLGFGSYSLLGLFLVLTLLCLGFGIALGEVDLKNKWGDVIHYNADPANNKLFQGNFKKNGGNLGGWKGSLNSVSSPETGMIRLKALEKVEAIETTLRCDPSWKWLTIMAKVRPADGSVLDEGQDASIHFTPVDMSGKELAPDTVLQEKRREGYTNWVNWIRTIPVPAGSYAIKVRISLAPGKGGLDCQEIGLVPSRAEDEIDHRLVDRFSEALKASDKKTVAELLQQEPKLVEARGFSDNGTPLTYCAWNELPEMAQLLIDHGANLNAVDYGAWRSTPLMWCGWWGSARTAEVLIKAGADAKIRSINGVTALSAAKAGKTGNGARKASPEAFDQTVSLMEAAEKKQ